MKTMKAAEFSRFGIPHEVVTIANVTLPEPQTKQIRCKTLLSPIHNHDLFIIKGEYGWKPEFPAIPGSEAVATVDAIGPEVSNVKIGARVAVAGIQGTWAEYFLAPAEAVIPVSGKIPDELAAQMIAMPFSTLMLLNDLNLKQGEWVVVNAANGAVGKLLFQLAESRKIHVAGLVRSEASKQQLPDLNADNIFITEAGGWEQSLRKAVGDGRIAACVDMIGGASAKQLLGLLDERGVFVSFGAMSDPVLELNVGDLIYKETIVKGFWGSKHSERATPQELLAISSEIIGLAKNGKLKLPVAEIFPLQRVSEAILVSGKQKKGKVLIKP